MKLSLRKARRLESKINTFVQSSYAKNDYSLPNLLKEGEDGIDAIIQSSNKKFEDDFGLREQALAIAFKIRGLIAIQNKTSKISELMGEKIFLLSSKEMKARFVHMYSKDTASDILYKVSKADTAESRFSLSSTIDIPLFTNVEMKDHLLLEISKIEDKIECIEDELMSLNTGLTVVLDNGDEEILREAKLIR